MEGVRWRTEKLMERDVPNFRNDDARETTKLNNMPVAKSRIFADP